MLTFFRRVAKSKIGTWVIAGIGVAILGGFALADLSNFGTGTTGFVMSSSTLAKVGDQEVEEADLADLLQRRLQQVRQEQPEAGYPAIMGDFNPIIDDLINQRTLMAFADKYGFPLSKRLIDAEIARLPAAKGLNGQFSDQAYQAFLAQQHLTDAKVRNLIATSLLQQLLLTPVATNTRIPVGMATPFANMLLEAREGEGALVPAEAFKAGLKPTDAQLQQYYAANRSVRYMIPEQRVLRIARIGPEQVANVGASEAEIAGYYNQHKDSYAPADTRSLSQVVVQHQATPSAIAQRAKAGANLAAAATSRSDASFKLPPELAPVLKSGFEIAPRDPPEVVTLPGDAGYAVVSPGQVTPASPAPLQSIHDQVASDWIIDEAMKRARAA